MSAVANVTPQMILVIQLETVVKEGWVIQLDYKFTDVENRACERNKFPKINW